MDLKSTWSQNSLIDQILSICHSNYYDVIQSLNTVNICQQLIDDLISNLWSSISA